MRNLRTKLLWSISFIALAVLIATPPYLYFTGLKDVPSGRQPLAQIEIPESVSRAYWRYLQGDGDPRFSPKNPYGFLIDFFVEARSMEANGHASAEYALLSDATRSLMFREKFDGKSGDWHLSNMAALIWISRNWSAQEAIRTVLQDTYFGNDFRGIDTAARGYFGISLEEMTDVQVAYLLVIRAAPNHYDPWCHPENHRVRFEAFSKRIGYAAEYESIESLPAPANVCS